MKIIFTVFVSFLLLIQSTYACLNGESKLLKNGFYLYEDYTGRVPYGHSFNLFNIDKAQNELQQLFDKTNDLAYLSDLGLTYIVSGKFDEAISLFHHIETISPNRYATAANLGTAYELIGNNESALQWIKRAIEINPNSHESSEWIHVNILKAKINGPEYHTMEYILKTSFGDPPNYTSDKPLETLETLANQIFFQLNERASFIKSKDRIMAELYIALGQIEQILGNLSSALSDYELAEKYAELDPAIIMLKDSFQNVKYKNRTATPESIAFEDQEQRDQYINKVVKHNNDQILGWTIVGIVVLFSIGLYLYYKNS